MTNLGIEPVKPAFPAPDPRLAYPATRGAGSRNPRI